MRLKDDYDAETMLAMISLEKNKLNRPKDVKAKTPVEQEFKEVYERFEEVNKDTIILISMTSYWKHIIC